MNQKKENKSLRAIFAGVFLVGVIFILTLFREPLLEKIKSLQKGGDTKEEVFSEKENLSEKESDLGISCQELFEKVGGGEMIVLDIRSRELFSLEHILDSQNVSGENLLQDPSFFDKSKKYTLVDEGNDLSARNLAEQISRKYSIKIYYLLDGFAGWKSSYNPTVSFGDPLSISDQAKVSYTNSEELKKFLDQGGIGDIYILDVRKAEDFSQGHIPGAVNIFLENLEKERRKIPLAKKVVICDKDGFWSYMGAVRLFDMGIKNTLILSDGLDGWQEKGFELAKD